jgi:hypothetical protein
MKIVYLFYIFYIYLIMSNINNFTNDFNIKLPNDYIKLFNKNIITDTIISENVIIENNNTTSPVKYIVKDTGKLERQKYSNDSMVKLIICTCIYKRHALTKFCIMDWLKSDIYKIIVIYSYDDDYDNIKDIGDSRLILLKYENLPLSNKWNYSLRAARRYNPDAIMIMGSDDIFINTYITKAKYYLNRGIEYISNSSWLNVGYYNNKIIVSSGRYNMRALDDGIGSARIYSCDILKKINFNLYLFEKPLNKILDYNSYRKVNKFITKKRYNIIKNSLILLKNPDDDIAITVKSNYLDYLKLIYKSTTTVSTIDKIIIYDYNII